MHFHNPRQDRARQGEQVAGGPARECYCPWGMEKETRCRLLPARAMHCAGLTMLLKVLFLFSEEGFLWEGSMGGPCRVLGDLLVISGSFLKLPLIYSSIRSFHLPRPSKGV